MPDTPIHDPIFDNQQLIEYVRDCNQKGAAVTMNIGVYEDGTASPATLKQLQDLRKGIRGY
jgi:accessory colonization factor AcfC